MNELPELPCRDFVECVTAYLEGALSEGDRIRLEAHLAECEACGLYLEQMRATIAVAGRIEPEALSPEVRSALMDVFDAWRASA